MRFFTTVTAIAVLTGSAALAQNIAPNPSFEERDGCPASFSEVVPPTSTPTSVLDWVLASSGSADYFHSCAPSGGFGGGWSVPDNFAGDQDARTGEAYCGLYAYGYSGSDEWDYREYVQGELTHTLPAGHNILVSYWVSQADNYTGEHVDQMGAYFTDDYIYDMALTSRIDVDPQVVSPYGEFFDDDEGWQEVTGTFVATGDESWMTIGNFTAVSDMGIEDPTLTYAYYYVDDVCVLDLDSVSPENKTITDTVNCTGTPLELGGHPGADNYLWDDGSTSATRTITETGVFWVRTIDKSTCTLYADSFYVTVGAPVPEFSIGRDTALCESTEILLQPDEVPTVGIWTWQDGSHGTSFTASTTGTYWLEVKNGCFTYSDTVYIVVAAASLDILTNDTTVCDGAEVPVNAVGSPLYTYEWFPSEGVSYPHSLNTIITVNGDSEYILKGSFGGCPDTLQHIIFQVQPTPEVTLREDTAVCPGQRVVLEPKVSPYYADYTYSWSPAAAVSHPDGPNGYIISDTTIMLYLDVETPIGCHDQDSVKISVFPPLLVSAVSDTGICPGNSVQLWAEGADSYSWSPSYGLSATDIASPVASPGTTTEYEVLAVDKNGCMDTAQVLLEVYPAASLLLPDSVTIWPGESYTMNPQSNCLYFDWFPYSGLTGNNISNPVASPEVRTRYFVTAVTEDGCVVTDSIDVLVNTETAIDMPNAFVPGNGANNTFKASKRGIATLTSFRIYNRWGNLVFETKDIDEGWDGSFNGAPQPAGVYLYTIEAVTSSGKPFVKQGNVTLLR